MSVTASSEADASAQASKALQRVPCIWYPIWFQESQPIRALIGSDSKINVMTPAYAAKQDLTTRKTSVGAQKIDSSPLKIHDIALARFLLQDSLRRVWFFEETFLLAYISIEVVLEMPFLALSNSDFQFDTRAITWRTYTIAETLPTTSRVELIDKKEFVKTILDENWETCVVHVSALKATENSIHLFWVAQIAILQWNKAFIEISTKYSDYANVFFLDLAMELPENTRMNEYTIKLINSKQPPYRPIYALSLMELETLKIYIETHLKTGFIWPFKSPTRALILFDKKRDSSFYLCVDYWGLNKLTIRNRYPLPLIGEALDHLSRAKRFIQLDFMSVYHQMRIWEDDEWKTTFCTRYGHFEYQVMPFGLSNTPASFQGYINKILAQKLDIFVVVYFDNILIYTKDPGKPHVDVVWWVLEQLQKHGLYTNLKKCQFHKDEVQFLGFVVLAQKIKMEEEKIEAVKTWPKPQSVRDIQVFLGFANFYKRFIQNFSKIVVPLTSILQTTNDETMSIQATRNKKNQDAPTSTDGDGIGESFENLSTTIKLAKSKKSKLTKSKKSDLSKANFAKVNSRTDFLTSGAKKAFIYLQKAFTKASILRYFDPEYYIRIETDALGYAIGEVLSQMISDQHSSGHVTHKDPNSDFLKFKIGQWHPVAFFLEKWSPLRLGTKDTTKSSWLSLKPLRLGATT